MNDVMIYKERRSINSGQVFIKYFKGLLTTAYLQKFLLQVIGICGRNDNDNDVAFESWLF